MNDNIRQQALEDIDHMIDLADNILFQIQGLRTYLDAAEHAPNQA